MLVPIRQWLPELAQRLHTAFPGRLRFLGLQGSYRRGEATEQSDIDIVAVLDELHVSDLETYRELIRAMPYGDQACGFLCGAEELRRWPRFDLLQLFLDTEPVFGALDGLVPQFTDEDLAQALHIGASVLYHSAVHTYLYDGEPAAALAALSKSAYFLLRLQVYHETGKYAVNKAELEPSLTGDGAAVLALCRSVPQDLESVRVAYALLLRWASSLLRAA